VVVVGLNSPWPRAPLRFQSLVGRRIKSST
jgi:hypothetical protein